jgi:hypothetical protein
MWGQWGQFWRKIHWEVYFTLGTLIGQVDDRTRCSDDRSASKAPFIPHKVDWDIDMDACRPANQCQTWHWTWNYRYHSWYHIDTENEWTQDHQMPDYWNHITAGAMQACW